MSPGLSVPTAFAALSARTVQVWRLPLATMSAAVESLDAAERERAARFRFPPDRRNYIITRGALRRILAAQLMIEPRAVQLDRSVHGKPCLHLAQAATHLRFNVAHAADWALVAVASGREVGVDLEPVRPMPDAPELARRCLSPNERRRLDHAAPGDVSREFLQLWTRKEAVLKASGLGISGGLTETDTTESPLVGGRWQVLDLPIIEGYVAAEGDDWRVQIHDLTDGD